MVSDLHLPIERLKAMLDAFARQGKDFPCAMVTKKMPPLPVEPTAIPDWDISPLGPEFTTKFETPKLDVGNLTIKGYPADKAAEFFVNRLIDFLHPRIASGGGENGGEKTEGKKTRGKKTGGKKTGHPYSFTGGTTPGLLFRVTTNTPGLQVHYTHAFYLKPSYVFGGPTTPVDSHISTGLWHFGTSQSNGPVTFDLQNVYNIPSVSKAHLPI
jgi:hypothetical protein